MNGSMLLKHHVGSLYASWQLYPWRCRRAAQYLRECPVRAVFSQNRANNYGGRREGISGLVIDSHLLRRS